MDIGGTNLKKLSFKDRSPSNHIAKFFKRHRWRNFFEIDMHSPEWTKDGKVAFCEEITKHDIWGSHTVGLIYWTINPDGTKKRRKAAEDEIVAKKPFDPINRFDMQDESGKHRKKIFLRDNSLWVLDFGENTPKRLVDN
jgi:hypothetical protein